VSSRPAAAASCSVVVVRCTTGGGAGPGLLLWSIRGVYSGGIGGVMGRRSSPSSPPRSSGGRRPSARGFSTPRPMTERTRFTTAELQDDDACDGQQQQQEEGEGEGEGEGAARRKAQPTPAMKFGRSSILQACAHAAGTPPPTSSVCAVCAVCVPCVCRESPASQD
jgi:hypothetical protein